MIPRLSDRRIVTYGFSPAGRCARASNVRIGADGAHLRRRHHRPRCRETARRSTTSACRCWASTTCRTRWPPSPSRTRWASTTRRSAQALAGFGGVKRRFTKTGEANGITVIDDYGHHPVEIAAVLKAARAGRRKGKVIAVVQPHRYTRLHNLFEDFCTCFNDADTVIVADVYAAGEQPIEGVEPRRAGRGPARARPSPRRAPAGPGGAGRAWWRRSRRPATSSSASAPAPSPPGPMRCRPSCRRSWRAAGRGASAMMAAHGNADTRLIDRLPHGARPPDAESAPLAARHLVPRRRPGRGAVPPGRSSTTWRRSCAASRPTCRSR